MTRVKICGVTRLEDAEMAVEGGAWAIGLNHWEGTPRRVELDAAAEIGAALKRRCELVGVFVNPSLDQVVTAVENAELTMVQLHGDEGPSFCAEVSRRTGTKVIKAIRVQSAAEVHAAERFRVDYHLLDAYRAGTPGGTGEQFDWELLTARRSQIPLILAGGLDPQNVAHAIEVTHPFAVDVATGVESAPGVKDPDLLAALFEAVPGAVSAEA
jgi:phosphoribosylanthranilate isomerase